MLAADQKLETGEYPDLQFLLRLFLFRWYTIVCKAN